MSWHADKEVLCEHDQTQESLNKLIQSCEPIERFLELKSPSQQPGSSFLDATGALADDFGALEQDGKSDGDDVSSLKQYFVPLNLIERWGSAMGILFLSDHCGIAYLISKCWIFIYPCTDIYAEILNSA